MKTIKKTDSYTIFQKRNGRYAIRGEGRQWVNAEEKVKLLLEAGLIKLPESKPAEPEPAEETEAEDSASEEGAEEEKGEE